MSPPVERKREVIIKEVEGNRGGRGGNRMQAGSVFLS
jgi:hypothetical protein